MTQQFPCTFAEYDALRAELAALRAENEVLREALKPFAQFRVNEQGCADTAHVFYSPHDPDVWLRVGHFRAARAALSTTMEPNL